MFKFSYVNTKWILLALTLVAGIMRYIGIGSLSLNFEEQLLWYVGTRPTIFDSIALLMQYKPASLLLGITTWLTNYNSIQIEFISRAISFIAGIACVPLTFFLARKFYSEIEGLVSAGIVAFSWICISISQSMNEHSLLFSLLLVYFIALVTFLDKISEDGVVAKSDNIFLLVAGILLELTSFWGIVTIVVSFFYSFFFITKINTFLKTLALFASILIPLGLLVWLEFHYSFMLNGIQLQWTHYINAINYVVANNYFLTIIILLPLLYLGYVYIKKMFSGDKLENDAKTKFSNSSLVLVIWTFGSIIIFILLTYFLNIKYDNSDLIFILPPLFILLSRSIILISNKLNQQIIYGALFVIVIMATTYLNLDSINNNPDYIGVARLIMREEQLKNDKSGIIFSGRSRNPIPVNANLFYLNKYHIKSPFFSIDGDINKLQTTLESAKQQGIQDFWIICDNAIISEQFVELLKSKHQIYAGYRYNGITLLLIE